MKIQISLLVLITALMALAGCKRTPNSPATQTNAGANVAAQPATDKAVESEIVTSAPISGVVSATGKVLVPEDRTAVIGPVNEGRIVKLYAGQGSRVRK